jgi:hypothetical protein
LGTKKIYIGLSLGNTGGTVPKLKCGVLLLYSKIQVFFLRRHNQWSPILWCAKQHENEQPPQSVRHSGSFQLNCVLLHFVILYPSGQVSLSRWVKLVE